MSEEKHGRGVEQAWRMLDLFASLDVAAFDLTTTDLDGGKCEFRRAVSWRALRQWIPHLLNAAMQDQHNLIVRPKRGAVELMQLDDLSGARLERLWAVAFLILATSEGNHQAWIAVPGGDASLGRRLRQASGADPSASGATRVAGSVNFKRKYAPDFPTVCILQATPHRTVTEAELEALDLVAGPEAMALSQRRRASGRRAKQWPSYERCLQNAPCARDSDRPDVSRADFTFCLLAIDWGWSVAATCQRLLEKSSKARENGPAYACRTVERAAAVIFEHVTRRQEPAPTE